MATQWQLQLRLQSIGMLPREWRYYLQTLSLKPYNIASVAVQWWSLSVSVWICWIGWPQCFAKICKRVLRKCSLAMISRESGLRLERRLNILLRTRRLRVHTLLQFAQLVHRPSSAGTKLSDGQSGQNSQNDGELHFRWRGTLVLGASV